MVSRFHGRTIEHNPQLAKRRICLVATRAVPIQLSPLDPDARSNWKTMIFDSRDQGKALAMRG